MYHYDFYRDGNLDRLSNFIRLYPLATIVSYVDGQFLASHLPLIVESLGTRELELWGHLDASNPQATALHGQTAHVIFAGPNRYISPQVYVTAQLPTWNYLAVHGTGRCMIEDPGTEILSDIERLLDQVEDPAAPYRLNRDEVRVSRLVPFIRRLRIRISYLEGRFKLSQEKIEADRTAAADHLLAVNHAALRPFVRSILGLSDLDSGIAQA